MMTNDELAKSIAYTYGCTVQGCCGAITAANAVMLEHLKQLLAVQLERTSCGDGMSISFDEPNDRLNAVKGATYTNGR